MTLCQMALGVIFNRSFPYIILLQLHGNNRSETSNCCINGNMLKISEREQVSLSIISTSLSFL